MFKGNKIYKIDKNGNKKRIFFVKGVNFRFKGKNSTVILEYPFLKFKHCNITCGDNCQITIGSSPTHVARRLCISANANNSVCTIGRDFSCTNHCLIQLASEPNKKVIIGDNCMFGSNAILRTGDSHSIIDIKEDKIINFGGDIELEDNVWLAANVTILKNTKIANNSVIALGSIVTKNCDTPNSIYAGSPAKLIKTGIVWRREAPTGEYND